jgi:hypothetical protein
VVEDPEPVSDVVVCGRNAVAGFAMLYVAVDEVPPWEVTLVRDWLLFAPYTPVVVVVPAAPAAPDVFVRGSALALYVADWIRPMASVALFTSSCDELIA